MFIAARGMGKTFLVAIYCVVRCILYPGTNICIASGVRKQSIEVLEKIITILYPASENLRLEIKDWKNNQADAYIEFHNTSRIKVVTANDSSRGNRANILIVDEFRLVPITIVNTVLRKFLTAPRNPGYLQKKEYQHLQERNKELYMSSAWYKSHWSFDKLKAYVANLVNDTKKYFVCGLPYQLSIKEGLLSRGQVEDEMSESDFSDMTWKMEMEAMWWGDTDGSLFTFEDVSQNRRIKSTLYPENYMPQLKHKIPQLAPNERRILSVDVALMASKKRDNDAASIWINSAIPNNSGQMSANFIYSENHEGLLTNELALIVRRYFDMYHCTDLVIDAKGIGLGVVDCLLQEMYDPDLGTTYSPLNCCNDDTISDRCSDKRAPKVIWAISASAQFNNDMYLLLREGFKQKKINLLISEFDCEDVIKDIKGYATMSPEDRVKLQMPYIHTTLLINELINLQYENRGAVIKVFEKSGMRKDRVSGVGYNYWVMSQIENTMSKRRNNSVDAITLMNFRQPQLYKTGKK